MLIRTEREEPHCLQNPICYAKNIMSFAYEAKDAVFYLHYLNRPRSMIPSLFSFAFETAIMECGLFMLMGGKAVTCSRLAVYHLSTWASLSLDLNCQFWPLEAGY